MMVVVTLRFIYLLLDPCPSCIPSTFAHFIVQRSSFLISPSNRNDSLIELSNIGAQKFPDRITYENVLWKILTIPQMKPIQRRRRNPHRTRIFGWVCRNASLIFLLAYSLSLSCSICAKILRRSDCCSSNHIQPFKMQWYNMFFWFSIKCG